MVYSSVHCRIMKCYCQQKKLNFIIESSVQNSEVHLKLLLNVFLSFRTLNATLHCVQIGWRQQLRMRSSTNTCFYEKKYVEEPHVYSKKLKFKCCGLTYISSVKAELQQDEPENTKKELAFLSYLLVMKSVGCKEHIHSHLHSKLLAV